MNTPSNDKSFEIESKFEVSSQAELDRMEVLFLGLSDDKYRERQYETIIRYYDTPDMALSAAGVVLRTMDECQPYFKPELNVKTKGFTNEQGVLVREEYEFFPKDNALDLSVVTNSHAKALLQPAQGKSLSESFNTVTRRHDICLVFTVAGKRAVIDLALDDISFVANDASQTVLRRAFETEIEFKGSFSDAGIDQHEASILIKSIKDQLATVADLKPIGESRAQTGFRLIAEKAAKASKKPVPKGPKAA